MIYDIVWKLMLWLWSKTKSFIRIFYISFGVVYHWGDGACFDVKNEMMDCLNHPLIMYATGEHSQY